VGVGIGRWYIQSRNLSIMDSGSQQEKNSDMGIAHTMAAGLGNEKSMK